MRQYPLYSKKEPPKALESHFTPEVFAKSQAYGKDKAHFALISGLYKQILETVLLQYGGYAWAWEVAGQLIARFGYGKEYEVHILTPWFMNAMLISAQITQSIVFSLLTYFVSTIPAIPLSLYQTFVLEEKHGFNKTTPALFVADLLKGWALAIVIATPFLSAFLYVFKWAGDRFIPWLMGFLYVFRPPAPFSYSTLNLAQACIPDHHGHHLSHYYPTPVQQALSLARGRAPHKDRDACIQTQVPA